MNRYLKDEGLIIKKTVLNGSNLLITFFTRNHGKITAVGYGIKSITSRRLSHLETGNYNRFTLYKKNDYYTLSETELMWGFSKIKASQKKLEALFLLLFVLNKILPENQPEDVVFAKTTAFLTNLNNRHAQEKGALTTLLNEILVISGFNTEDKVEHPSFNPIPFIENLIGQKIKLSLAYDSLLG